MGRYCPLPVASQIVRADVGEKAEEARRAASSPPPLLHGAVGGGGTHGVAWWLPMGP